MIVVQSEPPAHAYNRVQLAINRTTQAVEYNRIPQATRDASLCGPFTNKLFKWTLKDHAVALKDGLSGWLAVRFGSVRIWA